MNRCSRTGSADDDDASGEYDVVVPCDKSCSFSSTSSLGNDDNDDLVEEPDVELGIAITPHVEHADSFHQRNISDGAVSHGTCSATFLSGSDSVLQHAKQLHAMFVVPEDRALSNGKQMQEVEIKDEHEVRTSSSDMASGFKEHGSRDEEENEQEEGSANRVTSTASSTTGASTPSIKEAEKTCQAYRYDWHLYAPSTKEVGKFLRWAIVGGSRFAPEQSDEELGNSLAGLARCLQLLREYLARYGMPARGGPRDQEYVLKEVIKDLYAGGTPLWALEPVMQKAAEGLTGQPNVNWMIFPRKAFVYNPTSGVTSMFPLERGFNISKMSAMEGVAVRLASYASNVQGVSNIPARFPNPEEFHGARNADHRQSSTEVKTEDRAKLARKILNLASRQQGLFYYVNSRGYMGGDKVILDNSTQPKLRSKPNHSVGDFWVVTDDERELFSRLACQEALKAINAIDDQYNDPTRKTLYTPCTIMTCRVVAAAGACAFWFGGSWQDMIVSGALAIVVACIGTSSLLTKQERLIYEVVSSFIVGLVAGLLALIWPDHMCFSAMAISGVLDLLQGFRVVYAIIEIMSRHTMSGGADLVEGILFTGLISYFLQFGSHAAMAIVGNKDEGSHDFMQCSHGIDSRWSFLLVPMACLAWTVMFTPNPRDLPGMALHGVLGYCVNYGLNALGSSNDLNYFVSASAISLSAGIISRFTGRQAVANTVAGIYMLLPGAYFVSSLYTGDLDSSFFTDILKTAIIIGIGGWTGTIMCSPTLLGTTRGLLVQQKHAGRGPISRGRRRDVPRENQVVSSHPTNNPPFSNNQVHHRSVGSMASQSAAFCGHHNRAESNVSIFDFDHPTSTMLFF